MNDLFSAVESNGEPELPVILAIALRMAQIAFPELIYTGKLVSEHDDRNDCELCLFARNALGEPLTQAAISLEIMKVGEERSITAEYPEQEDLPILWYGAHGVWMDGETGKTVAAPLEGLGLERLARGILTKLRELDEMT